LGILTERLLEKVPLCEAFVTISGQILDYYSLLALTLWVLLLGKLFLLCLVTIVGTRSYRKFYILLWKRQFMCIYFYASEKQANFNSSKFTASRNLNWPRTKGSCFLSTARTVIHKPSVFHFLTCDFRTDFWRSRIPDFLGWPLKDSEKLHIPGTEICNSKPNPISLSSLWEVRVCSDQDMPEFFRTLLVDLKLVRTLVFLV
jgi:hypothetical protein